MTTAIEFDFDQKLDEPIPLERVKAAMAGGRFVWLDLDGRDAAAMRRTLRETLDLDERTLDECLSLSPDTKYDNRQTFLHLVVVGCHFEGETLEHDRVDVLIGERYFATVHRDPVPFIDKMKATYREDFLRYAQSPGFLLYELWDALLESYDELASRFDNEVERMQVMMFGRLDDVLFGKFAKLGADLLDFRKILAPTRNVLDQLATRKSRFVTERTQPFIGAMVPKVERILQDVMVNREVMSDSLNLYISIVSHKTNQIMNKLTVVSLIFLPLTFLCGVYGMNFEFLPEFKWRFGYVWFWGIVGLIVTGILVLLRRARLL